MSSGATCSAGRAKKDWGRCWEGVVAMGWLCESSFTLVQHPLRLSLSLAGTAALALASIPFAIRPVAAEEPKAESTEASDLGVMAVTLWDAVKFNYGFQGALQGQALPIKQV